MRIAAVHDDGDGSTEHTLGRLADALLHDGLALAGAVQRTVPAEGRRNKRMELVLLPGGAARRISAELPPGTPGCVLDHGALEAAAHEVAGNIHDGLDVVILSKFGQREAEGRGFRAAVVAAAEHGRPLIIGVAPARRAEFETFLGMTPDWLPADLPRLRRWVTDRPE